MPTATRENILDAATRLIHLRGFHNTSIDDILRESRVGKGNFYYYFKSKDELGYAALARTLERLEVNLLGECFAPGVDPWLQIETFLDRLVASASARGCTGGCPLGNLAIEMSGVHEQFRQRLTEAFDQVGARIADALERARAAGTLRPETDIPRLARFVLAGFEGAIMLGKLHQDPTVMAGVVDELKQSLGRHRAPAVTAAR